MATYYVATTGSNSGTGAIGDPWKTIQYGVNQLSGGDTLLIRAGTYNEAVSVPSAASGTSGAHTTIKAYTGETVVIDGEYQIPGGATMGLLQQAIDAGFVVYVGPNYRFVSTGETVYPVTSGPLVDIGADWVDFEDIKITRSLGRGLRIYSAGGTHDNVTVSNCEISYARWHCVTVYGDSDTLDGCDVHHSNMFAPFSRAAYSAARSGTNPTPGINWGSGIGQSPSTNMTVSNCKIHHHWGEGIIVTTNTTVEDCEIYLCYSVHLYVESADGCIVRRNLIWHNGSDFLRGGRTSAAIDCTNEYNGSPGSGTGSGTRIYNNIVVGCRRGIQWFGNTSDPVYYEDARVYNNTFINPIVDSAGNPGQLILVGSGVTMNDVDIYNNIFYTTNGATATNSSTVSGSSEGANLYNNCWFGISPAASLKGTGDVYARPQMKAPDASIINGPVAGNYQILADSPCVDAGTSSPAAPTDDYFGNARSTVDIGAHEYGGSPAAYLYPDFTGSGVNGAAPLTVTLTDASSASDTITARYWYYKLSGAATWNLFDDGNNTSVILQVNAEGIYDVRLRCITATQDISEIKTGFIIATAEEGGSAPVSSGIVGVASVYANTTSGSQLITLNNSGITPTFAYVTVTAATSAGNPAAGAILSAGMTDGTRTRSVGVTIDDDVATSIAGRSSRADNLIVINNGATGRDAHANFVSFGAGSITISWTVPPVDGYIVNVWAIAADDAYVGDETVASSMSVTAPNFQPSAILWLCGLGDFPSSGTNSVLSVGATTADTTGAVSIYWENGAAAGDNNGYVFDGSVGIASASGGRTWEFTPTIAATGWTSGAVSGSAFGKVAYGCIRLASNSVWCDVIDAATSTGEAATTTPAFLGGAALGIFSTMTAAGSGVTDGTAGTLSVGMWADTTQHSVGITNQSSADPTNTASHRSESRFVHVVDDDGSTTALQAYISANANGYDLDWETVQGSACKAVMLLIEGEAASGGNYDWFLPGTTAGLLAGFP